MKRGTGGSEFERKIAKQLSLWFTDGKRDDVFWRTSASGARSTIRAKQNRLLDECGDIRSTDPISKPFTDKIMIELKNGYNSQLDLFSMLQGKKNLIASWLVKAQRESLQHYRPHFMLVLNKKRDATYVFLSYSLAINLGINNSLIPQIQLDVPYGDYYVILWKDFLELKPKFVMGVISNG